MEKYIYYISRRKLNSARVVEVHETTWDFICWKKIGVGMSSLTSAIILNIIDGQQAENEQKKPHQTVSL